MSAPNRATWSETFSIPDEELALVAADIRARPAYMAPERLTDLFRPLAGQVCPDPFDHAVVKSAVAALQSGTPFSAIRLGDGEGNLLSFDVYPGTPVLDRVVVRQILEMQQDTFVPDDLSVTMVREMLLASILQADIIGVSGLWRPVERDVAWMIGLVNQDPRGGSGHWRSIDVMIRLAQTGALRFKTITSAHFYFGVIEQLSEIVPHASRVLLITDRVHLKDKIQDRFPGASVDLVSVGAMQFGLCSNGPKFLVDVYRALPHDMSGYCALIGAGPWAEIYCSWVKQRGGVALDVGSGLDLLDGSATRPIHASVGLRWNNRYAIRPDG